MKVKGIKITIILSLLASILMPFSVFADDYTSSTVVGYDVSYVDTVFDNVQNKPNYIYEVRITLDDSYVGYINISGTVSYNDGTAKTLTLSATNRFVNGNQIVFRFYIIGVRYANAEDRPSLSSVQLTYGNHSLTKHSDIQSLEEIINILNNLYSNTDGIEGLMNNQLSQLQDIVLNTSNLSSYLDTLTKLRQWNIPFESYPTISYALKNNFDIFQFRNLNDYQIPLFSSYKNDVIYKFTSCPTAVNARYDYYNVVIMMDRSPSESTMNNNLILDDGQWVYESRLYEFNDGTKNWNIAKWHINNFQNAGSNKITLNYTDLDYCILYFGPDESESMISTDFALQFGFKNELLNNLNIIANGNNNYDQSKDDLDDDTSDFVTDSGNLIQIEENYLDDLDTSLQSIDTNTGLNIFGGNFLTSATWVRTQFDRLTYNNPFGSLIVYGMTLGLALLLLGKVML